MQAGYDLQAQASLLCEADGTPQEVAHEVAMMEAVLSGPARRACRHRARKPRPALLGRPQECLFRRRPRVAGLLLHGRHDSRRHLARVLGAIEQMEDDFGLRCANVFHAGDGTIIP